jgi:hypothetical protein
MRRVFILLCLSLLVFLSAVALRHLFHHTIGAGSAAYHEFDPDSPTIDYSPTNTHG